MWLCVRPSCSYFVAPDSAILITGRRFNSMPVLDLDFTELEARLRGDSFFFHTLVGTARCEVLVFLGSAARPFDHYALDPVALAEAKGNGQFRLRKITRTAFNKARLARASI